MAIITISRGSYSRGKEVAEKVAERLGYQCIGRDVLLATSEEFNIPEIKLIRAIHDAPSVLDRFTYGKEKYIAFIQAALLRHFRKDNLVYHGLAGHFFVRGVSHVLKVRIISDLADRVRLEMEREKISEKEARRIIEKDDEERRKWSRSLYGIDTWDPCLYDLVIHIHKLRVEDAVDIICLTAGLKQFQMTIESRRAIDNLALAAEVKAVLIKVRPDIQVSVEQGTVSVETRALEAHEAELIQEMESLAKTVSGVSEVRVKVVPAVPYGD
jgi:cytidylate kinase